MNDPFDARFADWAPALASDGLCEIFLELSQGTAISFDDSKPTDVSTGSDRGAGLRSMRKNPETGEVESLHGTRSSLNPVELRALADSLLSGRARRPSAAPEPRADHRQSVRLRPAEISIDRKMSLLQLLDRTIRSEFPHIRQVHISYAERERRFAVLNSEGIFKTGDRVSLVLAISVTAEKDGLLQTGFEVIGALKGWEVFENSDPVLAARRAARSAVEKLSAPVAPGGEMPVVLSSSAGGTFVHEAIGHSLEADHVQEGTSPHYAGQIGRTVAPEFLTIVDDPSLPFARGSFAFDDEGTPAAPTPLVKNGVLVDYLYDRATAMREGRASNGHGRRESFRSKAIPRMSNLYIAPGKEDPAAILKSLGHGLFVTRMGGGEVNTATGEFVFAVDEGFLVENGKIVRRVRDANMLGVGPEVLKSIDRIGWDIGWGIGTCGKQGQGVPVSDAQPTLRIPKLLIGGRDE